MYCIGKNIEDVIDQLNDAARELYEWCRKKQLTVHTGKTEAMIISHKTFTGPLREVSFFTRRGGLLKIGGGDQVLCLRSKGGIKRFFQIKKGGSLIFFKEIKYFVKHSWNSC